MDFESAFKFSGIHWALIATFVATAIYYYILRTWNYFQRHGIAFDRGVPIFGSYYRRFFYKESLMEMLRRLYYEHPNERFIGMYEIGGGTSYLIRDPELVKDITTRDFDSFVNRIADYHSETDPIYARGLTVLRGDPWRAMRSTLTPLYTSSKFKTVMLPAMIESKQRFTEKLCNELDNEKSVDFVELSTRSAIDAFGRCAFGIQTDALDNQNSEFKVAVEDVLANMKTLAGAKEYAIAKFPRLMKLLFNATALSQKGAQFFRQVLVDVIEQRKVKNVERFDIIGLVINTLQGQGQSSKQTIGKSANQSKSVPYFSRTKITQNNSIQFSDYTLRELLPQCFEFFEAVFTENNVLVNYIAVTLADHPQIQERLREEILELNSKLDGQTLTNESLRELKYMDMVLSEALRICPITTQLRRRATKPYTLTNSQGATIQVQPGENVWMPSYTLTNDPQYFPEPQKFDPERFSDENKKTIPSGVYAPYGMGPRNCIGCQYVNLEVKVTFFYLLQNFDLIKIEKKDGMNLMLRRRATTS